MDAQGTIAASGDGRGRADEELAIALASLDVDSPLRSGCVYVVSSPGKRFRGAMVETAAHFGVLPPGPRVQRAAIAVELFHAATLAHDDVVDDGQLRRGMPSVGAQFGGLAASLVGGWLFARAVELVGSLGDEEARHFADAAAVVCEGEMLETRDLHDVDRSRERYLRAIEGKTARLIAFSAWLGARAGGADREVADSLERYGEAVGMAFQIADDILDLVGDPAQTGKLPGTDLRQGVFALPTIYALEADPSLHERLIQGPEEHELPELVARIEATGAIEAALLDCREWIGRAQRALPAAAATEVAHERDLLALATSVPARVEEAIGA